MFAFIRRFMSAASSRTGTCDGHQNAWCWRHVRRRIISPGLLAAAWTGMAATAQAQAPGEGQLQRLTDPRGSEGEFGVSLSLQGGVLLAGAPRDDNYQGSVLVHGFDAAANQWSLQTRLQASLDVDYPRRFGHAVAQDGGVIVVGAPQDGYFAASAGAAYVFEWKTGQWRQTAKLLPGNGHAANEQMGWSVAVRGNIVVAGRPNGAVYVFERNPAANPEWQPSAQLIPPDGTLGDMFGSAISLSGQRLAVAAYGNDPFRDPSVGTFADLTGSVYLYRRQADASWVLETKLVAGDAAPLSFFGQSVVLQGDTCVVGAAGKAYVFERLAGVWTETAKLEVAAASGAFGFKVALDGEALVVCDPEDAAQGDYAGALHVYAKENGAWTPRAVLRAADGGPETGLGFSVALAGDTLASGAYGADASGQRRHAVYLFEMPDGPPNRPPTDLRLDHARVAENQPAQTPVGTFVADDPDAGETFSYALVPGAGAEDNALFTIRNGTLFTLATMDHGVKSQHTIRVQATDSAGHALEKALLISVLELPGPSAITLSGLNQPYDGTPRVVAAVTSPAGLNYVLIYAGGPQAPVQPGTYAVIATIDEPGFFPATAEGLLVVSKATQTIDSLDWPEVFLVGTSFQGHFTDQGLPLPTFSWTEPMRKTVTLSHPGDSHYEPISVDVPVRVFSPSVLRQRFTGGRFQSFPMHGVKHTALAAAGHVAAVTFKPQGAPAMVHLFAKGPDGRWLETQELRPSRRYQFTLEQDAFGSSLALDPGARWLAVAEPQRGAPGTGGFGAVSLFERDAAGWWHERTVLTAPAGMGPARFGETVAFAGQTLCVGTPDHLAGRVDFFEQTPEGGWAAAGTVAGSQPGSRFGSLIAADGGRLAVWSDQGGTYAVELFARGPSGAWNSEQILSLADVTPGSRLQLSGERLLIAAPAACMVWERGSGGVWGQTATLPGTTQAALAGDVLVAGNGTFLEVHRRASDGRWRLVEPVQPVRVDAEPQPIALLGEEVLGVLQAVEGYWNLSSPVSLTSLHLGRDVPLDPAVTLQPASFSFPSFQPKDTLIGELTSAQGGSVFFRDQSGAVLNQRWLVWPFGPGTGNTTLPLEAFNLSGVVRPEAAAVISTAFANPPVVLQAPAPAGGEEMGISLAATDAWLAAGSRGDRVYLFRNEAGTWTDSTTLTPSPNPNVTSNKGFGLSVALWGNRLAAGAEFDGPEPGELNGRVRVFEADASGAWNQTALLEAPLAPSMVPQRNFGHRVALSGDVLAVSAPNTSGFNDQGRVYLFRRQADASWKLEAELAQSAALNLFGRALAVHGDLLAIGSGNGAFLYERQESGHWEQIERFHTGEAQTGPVIQSLALAGGQLVIGSLDSSFTLHARVYERQGDRSWLATAQFIQPGVHSLAVRGGRMLAGPHLYRRCAQDVWLRELLPLDGPGLPAPDTASGLILGQSVALADPDFDSKTGRLALYSLPSGGAAATPPSLIALDQAEVIADDAPPGAFVGRLSAEDADAGDSFAFELLPCGQNNDNAHFAIDGSFLRTATRLDVRGGGLQLLRLHLRVTDAQGHQVEQELAVVVRDVVDWPDEVAWLGTEPFDYPDGPAAGQNGGYGFDFDNTTANGVFTGHTGTASVWEAAWGSPQIIGGRLVTADAGAIRRFNGPGTGGGVCDDELAGAFSANPARRFTSVYFRVAMTRSAGSGFSGLSGLAYGGVPFFSGVISTPNPASGAREFGLITDTATGQWTPVYSGLQPVAGQTYFLVVRADFAAEKLSLWLDPDFSQSEASQPPLLVVDYPLAVHGLTGLQLHSGQAPVEWDDLAIATEWAALGAGGQARPPASSLPDFLLAAGLPADAGTENDQLRGDGITLLMDWALGLDPVRGVAPGQPNPFPIAQPPAAPGDAPRFYFILPNELPPPLHYQFQVTTALDQPPWLELARRSALGAWHATGPAVLRSTPYGPHHRRYELRLTAPLDTESELFARLRVTTSPLPPP